MAISINLCETTSVRYYNPFLDTNYPPPFLFFLISKIFFTPFILGHTGVATLNLCKRSSRATPRTNLIITQNWKFDLKWCLFSNQATFVWNVFHTFNGPKEILPCLLIKYLLVKIKVQSINRFKYVELLFQ